MYEYTNKKKKDGNGKDIENIKDLTETVRVGKNEITQEENKLVTDYANKITKKKISNAFGLFSAAEKEAAHNIKMGVKSENKPKSDSH